MSEIRSEAEELARTFPDGPLPEQWEFILSSARREGAAAMKERAAQVAEEAQAEVDRRNQRRPSTYLDSVNGDSIASAIRALGEDE